MNARRPSRDEILALAIAMHARDEAAAPVPGGDPESVAAELGVPPEYLERAEAQLRHRAWARARRRRLALGVGGVAVAVALTFAVVRALAPAPWSASAEVRRERTLEVSPGTLAGVRFEDDAARGPVAVVEVSRAAPRPDGTWFVNLDGPDAPVESGHGALVIELAGTLPNARVYLEAGADERWRSPPIAVQPEWTTHRLRLATFERQRRVGGKWQAAEGPPRGPVTVSVKLGHFVNDAAATGVVRVAGVALE